jgi:PAS domain S-box-containing protein
MAEMHDEQKTKEELIAELQRLRHRVAELQESENQRKQAEEAMRQAEQRYRAVAESAVTGIGIVDPEETLTFVNSAFAEMLGYAQEELTGMSLSQLADPEEFAGYQERTKERAETDVHSHYETALRRKDGSVLNILVSASPLTASDGSFEGTLAVIVDITERKRAEEALRRAHEALADYTDNLERQTAQLRVASEVARDAAAIRQVPQLLDEAVRLISDRFGFYHTGIFLVDEQNEYAVLRAASSEGGRRMRERGHKVRIGEGSIVGYAVATGAHQIALDAGADAVFFDNPDLPDTRSEIALPLNLRGRTIGILDIQSTQETAFSRDSGAVLQTLADQLAIAIDNGRLVERTEAQLRELSLLYGEYSAAAWARLASPEHTSRYLYDHVDVAPVEQLSVPALDLALERGETVVIVEPEAMETVLATPLKVRDQIIGALGIQETDEAREWSPHEIALVEAVSEQVALALENARLFAETQKSAQTMQALYETSRVLSSTLEEEALMRTTLEAVYHSLGCEYAIISTVDERTKIIGIRHGIWRGEFDVFPGWIQAAQYPLDHPDILADIYRTGRTEIIGEWDARFNRAIWEEFGHERLLRIFMPIKARGRVIGVVEAGYDKRQKGDVGGEEVQMLAAFVDQAAVALENVRLFEEAQRRAQQEHQTYEIAAKIRRSPDVATILQTAVDELGQALHTDRALIRLKIRPREGQKNGRELNTDQQD